MQVMLDDETLNSSFPLPSLQTKLNGSFSTSNANQLSRRQFVFLLIKAVICAVSVTANALMIHFCRAKPIADAIYQTLLVSSRFLIA